LVRSCVFIVEAIIEASEKPEGRFYAGKWKGGRVSVFPVKRGFPLVFRQNQPILPAENTIQKGLGPPGDRKTLKQKQHREPSPCVHGLSSALGQIPITENDLRAEHGLMPRIKYN